MVAVPLCLQNLILNDGENEKSSASKKNCLVEDAKKSNIVSEARIIPLFMSTLPRLDCLKVIYSYMNKYGQYKKHLSSTFSDVRF